MCLAHTLQNAASDLAQACCALRSSNRWAITGTPIQNKLTDFASLVKFLQVYPYSELEIFDKDISRPWRGGEQQGFLRLKALVRAITISRPKAIVNLPPRSDYIHHLDFSGEERVLYDDAKKQTVVLLQAAISSSQGGRTFNALQRLNTLRLICSHGLLAQSNQSTGTSYQAQSSVVLYAQSFWDSQ
jgi:SWI/SNF-related matrix-associated actin-dependent regulator of chromatin subfamily A3